MWSVEGELCASVGVGYVLSCAMQAPQEAMSHILHPTCSFSASACLWGPCACALLIRVLSAMAHLATSEPVAQGWLVPVATPCWWLLVALSTSSPDTTLETP